MPRSQTLNLRHEFSIDEITELGRALAEEEFNLGTVSQEKANAVSEFNARIKEAETKIQKFTTQIRDGYTMKDVECSVEMDEPRVGKKTITRLDTGFTWIDNMSDDDVDLFIQ